MSDQKQEIRKAKQINILAESFARMKQIVDETMHGEFSRKPSFTLVIESMLEQINQTILIKDLQKKAVNPKDFNEIIYQKYWDQHGKIDYNSIVKKVISGEVSTTDLL